MYCYTKKLLILSFEMKLLHKFCLTQISFPNTYEENFLGTWPD